MAFWDREKDQKQSGRKPVPWEEARMIKAELAAEPEILAPGWYFYKEDYLWHGLKPNDSGDGFQKGFDFQDLRELQNWLGVPVPRDLLAEEETRETLTEQIDQLRRKPAPILKGQPPEQEEPDCSRKRYIDIHIRASPQEHEELMDRVTKLGMTKTNYLLRCALQSEVPKMPQAESSKDLQSLLDLLSALLAEVGRQGGMLKMVIKPNEGQRPLHPEEWDALIQATQDQARIKKKIETVMESVNGYFKTHDL